MASASSTRPGPSSLLGERLHEHQAAAVLVGVTKGFLPGAAMTDVQRSPVVPATASSAFRANCRLTGNASVATSPNWTTGRGTCCGT